MRQREIHRQKLKEIDTLCKELKELQKNKPQMAWYADASKPLEEYYRREHEISTKIIIKRKNVQDELEE